MRHPQFSRYHLIPLFLLIAGCSLDYSQVSLADEMSEEIPDSILREFSYTKVENGSPAYRLDAERAEFYSDRNLTSLNGLVFREYDSTGGLITEGRADAAAFFTDTESAELEGTLRFYSAIEEATVTTDYLYWDAEEKRLVGNSESRAVLVKDDGSRLDGIGFEVDVRRRLVDFTGPVSGKLVTKSHE